MSIDTAAERARLAALEGHTPGPWQCSRADLASYDADTGAQVSYLYPGDGERVRFETDNPVEDARLAAAAPDLKATLAIALDEIDRLRGTLTNIDALDPEGAVDGFSVYALRGLVNLMGNHASAALSGEGET